MSTLYNTNTSGMGTRKGIHHEDWEETEIK